MPRSKLHMELMAYSPPTRDHKCSVIILTLCGVMTTSLTPIDYSKKL